MQEFFLVVHHKENGLNVVRGSRELDKYPFEQGYRVFRLPELEEIKRVRDVLETRETTNGS